MHSRPGMLYKIFGSSVCASLNWGIMLRMVFSIEVTSANDMARLEQVVSELLGGEHNKCAFIRSEAFLRLRICALYRRGANDSPISAFWEGLKVSLTPSGTACVYVTEACVEEAPRNEKEVVETESAGLGKRSRSSSPPNMP